MFLFNPNGVIGHRNGFNNTLFHPFFPYEYTFPYGTDEQIISLSTCSYFPCTFGFIAIVHSFPYGPNDRKTNSKICSPFDWIVLQGI